jgi:NADH-quinone oxidoreductase subunit H
LILPEAEGELVAGYHVEYTSLPFAFFYISEYANFIFNAILINLSFLLISSHSDSLYILNYDSYDMTWLTISFIFIIQICIRASFPRYMIENIMEIGWKFALPINLAMVFLIINLTYINSFS